MVTRSGFTLVEILVALVVLEVGLLGVVATLTLAARILTRAELEEAGTSEVERVLDSLAALGVTPGEGTVPSRWGRVEWTTTTGGRVRLVFGAPVDSALVVVEGIVPVATGGGS